MELRETFNTVAELYDRARPGYPPALYEDLAALTGARAGMRVLEIAPGTGKATVPLAERGYAVTAVEMGAELAAVARRNLARYPEARVVTAKFEEWGPPAEPFDLVCCATAFSWLDPALRLDRCAAALRPGGHLAVWDTHHVEGGTGQFFIDVQGCYERWDPATPPGLRLSRAEDIPVVSYGMETHPAFEAPVVRDYLYEVAYTTETYLDVLGTYSNHIALPEPNRGELFRCIAALLEQGYGGRIVKAYMARLLVARRRA